MSFRLLLLAAMAVATSACTGVPRSGTSSPLAPTAAQSATPAPVAIATVSIPHATIEYYDVAGQTATDLRLAMSTTGPVDQFGARHDSYTAWFVHWDVPRTPEGTCNVGSSAVDYSIRVTFPEWQPSSRVDTALVSRWNTYVEALAMHESGHAQLVADAIPLVRQAIAGSDCDHYDAKAQAVLDLIRQRDLDYDTATAHGRTQGAHFP